MENKMNEQKMFELQLKIKELEERKGELKEKIDVLMEEWRGVNKLLSDVRKERYGVVGKGADGAREVKMAFDSFKLKYDNWAIDGGKLYELGKLLKCSWALMYGKEKYDRVEGSKAYRYNLLRNVREVCYVEDGVLMGKVEDGEDVDIVKFLGL